MTYAYLPQPDCIQRTTDGAIIPADMANADWCAYLAWVDAGGQPAPVTLSLPDWSAECQNRIAAFYSCNGISARASMNTWAACVALKAPENRTQSDRLCARMVPLVNVWEEAMFLERDRLIKAGALQPDDARWPVPPEGVESFIAACNQG